MARAFLKTMKEIRIIVFAARDLLGLTVKVPKTQYLRPKTPSESGFSFRDSKGFLDFMFLGSEGFLCLMSFETPCKTSV